MQHHAAFHLGLHCLSNYLFRVSSVMVPQRTFYLERDSIYGMILARYTLVACNVCYRNRLPSLIHIYIKSII